MQSIEWGNLSRKHKRYINNAKSCKMSVAEGSIRSGKTIDNCIIAWMYLENCPDLIHLATGSTIANAKLNIGDCNGYGLEHIFAGRCKWGKYKGNECLDIYTADKKTKHVIFAGGAKSDSYKRILGNSYGLWIATEINEHYDSEDSRESFVKVAFGRQVASKQPKVLWDLNPCNPRHKIYTDYIDRYKDTYKGGYNYQHFTLADNLTISEERFSEIASQYDINSIWYRRDILGERCVAEGLIYRQFADNPAAYKIDKIPPLVAINIGVDFGGNGSATTFVATGFTPNLRQVIALESERHREELNPEQLNQKYADFVSRVYSTYGKAMRTYADSAEQILIRGLRKTAVTERLYTDVLNAYKRPINDRIRLLNKLIAQNRFYWAKGAESVKNAICEQVWNIKKEDERLDDNTTDVDSMDALEYSIEPFMGDLSRF